MKKVEVSITLWTICELQSVTVVYKNESKIIAGNHECLNIFLGKRIVI